MILCGKVHMRSLKVGTKYLVLSVIIVSKNMGRCYLNETYIIFMVLKADFEDNNK